MWRPQIVRKSLVAELRNKLEEDLCDKAEEITKREIEQEINIIKAVKEVNDAWVLAMDGKFKEIPQIVWYHYSQLPRFHREPCEYVLPLKKEADYMVRKEAVSLSLLSHLYRPLIDPTFQKFIWGIRTWRFVWLCQNHDRLATLFRAKEFLDDMKKVITKEHQHQLMETVVNLKERLEGISNNNESEVKTLLLDPLGSILKVKADAKIINEKIDNIIYEHKNVLIDIPHTVKLAKERVENILEGLPDPKKCHVEKQ